MLENLRYFLFALTLGSLIAPAAAFAQETGDEEARDEDAPPPETDGVSSVLDAVRRLREEERRAGGAAPEASGPAEAQFLEADDLPPLLPTTPPEGEPFDEGLAKRRGAMAAAEEDARGDAVLDLAEFYYSWGLFNEARGAIEYLEQIEFDAAFDPRAQLLREAALVASGQGAGESTLQLGILSALGHEDAVMWSGVVAARDGDWRTAAYLGRNGGVDRAADYAWPFNATIAAVFAEAFVETGAETEADRVIARFQPEDLRLATAGRPENYPDGPAALLRAKGRLEETRARYQAALAAYDAAAEGNDYNAFDSRFRALSLRFELGLVAAAEAARGLTELSYAWRGDDLEARALFKLADIREEQGRPDLALRPLASAASRFRRTRVAAEAGRRLEQAMRAIFVEGRGPSDPIVRLDLYQRYRPALGDVEGWEVIDAAVVGFMDDLQLDGASYSVARRMEARTSGRFQAATYLLAARKHLENERPQRALESLSAAELALARDDDADEEETEDEASPLGGRGVTIRARALDAIGREEQAFEVLREDGGVDALYTLAQMSWEKGLWRQASNAYRDARLVDPDVQPSNEDLARERLAKFLASQAGVAPPRPDDDPWRDVIDGLFGPVDPPLLNLAELVDVEASEATDGPTADGSDDGGPESDAAQVASSGAVADDLGLGVETDRSGGALGLSEDLLSQINPELLAAVEAERAARQRLRRRAASGVDSESSVDQGVQEIAARLRAEELEDSLAEVDVLIDTAQRIVDGEYPSPEGDSADESE